ncbi:MAG: hypothetical protein KAH95_11075 [Spirochaetales bacterium]|nr:hypothetical protein [Spirochaetales bacterium]
MGELLDNITLIAKEAEDLKIALEYKPKEPRNYCFMARAADTLLLAQEDLL